MFSITSFDEIGSSPNDYYSLLQFGCVIIKVRFKSGMEEIRMAEGPFLFEV